MNVLVTGGEGHLGSHLVKMFLARGVKVKVLDKNAGALSRLRDKNLVTIIGGIEDKKVVTNAVAEIDALCHFAYTFSNDLALCDKVNVKGTENLLKAAKSEGVKHFLHASSVGVIGRPRYAPIDEKHPCQPGTLFWPTYGVTKHRIEKLVMSYTKRGLQITAFRFSYTYSEDFILSGFDGDILGNALKNGVIEVPKNSGADWNHANEIAQGFVKAILNRKAYGEVFQLSSDAYLTWRELAQHVIEWTKSKSIIREVPSGEWRWSGFSQDPSYDLRCSSEKAKRFIGYAPKYPKEKYLAILEREVKKRL